MDISGLFGGAGVLERGADVLECVTGLGGSGTGGAIGPAFAGGEGAGLVGAGGISLAVEGGVVGILFEPALRGNGGAGTSCLIFFDDPLAGSVVVSPGRLGPRWRWMFRLMWLQLHRCIGGCHFAVSSVALAVVSAVAFAVSVDALAVVSALGLCHCCNCPTNFCGGGLNFAFSSASRALCSTGLDFGGTG